MNDGTALIAEATREFAEHKLEVIRDDGLYRHLRCHAPGTWIYGFDVVTWPGYLCLCGDIGTWAWSRERDMLPWFEKSSYRGEPNLDYWASKLEDGPSRARRTEWRYDEEYEAEGPVNVGWNAQYVYACVGVLLAIRLYRKQSEVARYAAR